LKRLSEKSKLKYKTSERITKLVTKDLAKEILEVFNHYELNFSVSVVSPFVVATGHFKTEGLAQSLEFFKVLAETEDQSSDEEKEDDDYISE